MEPRPPDKSPIDSNWELLLGEPPEQAVERFLKEKVLRVCGVTQTIRRELPKLTVEQLRGLLHERGLPVSGNKEELVDRLTQRFEPGLLLLVPNRYLLECSDQGKGIVENFLLHGIEPVKDDTHPEVADATMKVVKWLLVDIIVGGVIYDNLKDLFVKLLPDEPLPAPRVEPVPSPPAKAPEAGKTPEPPKTRTRQSFQRTVIFEPEIVHIPAGYFWMGSDKSDLEAWEDEKPQHRVYLSEYWIGRYPVTVAHFAVFVRETGYETDAEKNRYAWDWRHPRGRGSEVRDKADHPVTWIFWSEAIAFCKWLSEVSGKHYTLPSEAQWEKAARGLNGLIYPWGNRWDASKCNSSESGIGDTTPVGKYSPLGDSPYGCADMAGNVWEWCLDWYDENEYLRRVGSAVVDPRGPESGASRVRRGGSFYDYRWRARCARRSGSSPVSRSFGSGGFRVVVSPG